MSIDTLSPEFQEVLLHDILPGKTRLLPAKQDLIFGSPNHTHIAAQPDGRIIDLTSITPEKNMELVTVSASSKRAHALADKPLEQYKAMYKQLHDGLELTPPDDFWVVSVHEKLGGQMVSGTPSQFLVTLGQDNFHEIAMEMLAKLADPRQGSQFAHGGDKARYEADLGKKDSETAKLITHIIVNAKLTVTELDDLRNSAARKQNFEFCARLLEAGDLLHPGFSAARTRKVNGLHGAGRPNLPGM